MPADVIIDPSTGQIYWNDGTGSPQSISIKGDAQNAISFVGYSGSYSPGSSVGGTQTLVTVNDSAGTNALVPGTSGFDLGSSTLRWNTFATNANLSGTLVVSDSTISSSLLTGSTIINGGIAISGNASIGQSLNFYNTAATFYTGFRAGTISANTLYTLPTAFPGSGTSVLQSDTSGTLTWVGSIGTATTATNVNVVSASTSASHPVLFTPSAGTASGAALSTESTFVYNPSTDILSVSGLAITSTTASTSPTTGALIVAGGVGIGGSLYVGGTGSSISGVRISSAAIFSGDTTFALINTNATTVNAFGAATTMSIGAATGKATFNSTDNSTTVNTGALAVSGGAGIAKSLSIGGYLQLYNSNFYTSFVSAATANTVYTLPPTSPATGSSVLQSTSAGVMSWVPMTATSSSSSGGTVYAGVINQIAFYGATGNTLGGSATFLNNIATGQVQIAHTTASTGTSTGALQVAGGVGISGRLSFNQASFGTTGIASLPTMAMIGQTGDPIYMSILEDNSISFEGSQGQLFSITPNLTTGYIWSVNDISGVPFLRASVGGTIGIAEFGGVVGIGQTNPTYKLDLKGSFGLASSNDALYNFIFSNSAASGSNSLQIRSANSLLLYNSGNSFYTGLKSNASANVTYTLPVNDGSADQFLKTNGSGVLSWGTPAGGAGGGSTGVGAGGQYELAYYPGTGASVIGNPNVKTNTVTSVVSIDYTTASLDYTSGALKVSGGVGIGGSLFVGGIGASISGITILSSAITKGVWNGTVIAPQYGGTGLNNVSATGLLQYSSGTASVITTSSSLSSIISDITGTAGKLVFSISPTFTTSVVTDSASFNVFNTTATTINAFGNAGTISIGSASGTATFNSTTNTTASNTGAVVFSGGVGIGKSVSVGGYLHIFNGSNYSAFRYAGTANTIYTLPGNSPQSASGTSVLSSTIDGTMSWVPLSAGGSGSVSSGTAGSFAIYATNGTTITGTSLLTFSGSGLTVGSLVNATSTTEASLSVRGGLGVTGNAFIGGTASVTSTTATFGSNSGALVVSGGVGIGGTLFTSTTLTSSVSGVLLLNGIITSGTWSGSTITAFYGGTGLQGPTAIGDLIVANTATTWSRYATSATSGQVLTSNGTGSAPSWQNVPPSAASSVAVAPTVVNSQFSITAVSSASGSGLGLSTISTFVVNPSNNIVSVSGLAVTHTTTTTNASSGALIVTGGAAVGQTLSVGGSLNIFNGANYSGLKYAGTANTVYTLPGNSPQSATGTSILSSTIAGVMSWIGMSTGGSATAGGINKQIQYNSSNSFAGASGFEYTTGGIASTVSIFSASGSGYTSGLWIHAINGSTTRVGIGLSNPQFELEILGEISATNKSFVIDHPTKQGMKLRYGSLEGPENGVYVRGELKETNIIEVPDHWIGLVHEDSYTVHLTPIGRFSQLYVEKIENYNVFVADTMMCPIHCYYSVWAERKDIPKLVTEYEAQ